MGRRRQAREFALQALYLVDAGSMSGNDAIVIVSAESKLDAASEEFARGLVLGTEAILPELDKHIQSLAKNWALERMAMVDRNILRLAAYEILHRPDTPATVAINEALDIAKRYSTPDSFRFINGILDKIKFERPKAAADEQSRESA